MATFRDQPMSMVSAMTSGASAYARQKSRILRRFLGEKPLELGYALPRYSAAATAAPFSGLALTSLPISQYSSICGRDAFISKSIVANMAL
nr:hypothetical protein [uncultured Oscillibacter sp.]